MNWVANELDCDASEDYFLAMTVIEAPNKLCAYVRVGVKECWLVLVPEKQIEIHRQPQGEQFAERTVHGAGGRVATTAVPSFTLGLDRLFAA